MSDPKDKPIGDFGTHIDQFEGDMCQASSAIKADLDANLSPQKPVTPAEAQRMFESIGRSLPLGLYSFLITGFSDVIILLKQNRLLPHRQEAGVLAQWLSVPDKQVKESDLSMRLGTERWALVRSLLEERLNMLDSKKLSPTVRRIDELGLSADTWKRFLRNAMLYISCDRSHRRQLAEVFRAIRDGTVPSGAPLEGDFNQRTVTLSKLLMAVAREYGSNTLGEFALDLLHEAGIRPGYSVIKEIMYINCSHRRRFMDAEIRGSGELKQHLSTILARYMSRVHKDRETNFDMHVLGEESPVSIKTRRSRATSDQVAQAAEKETDDVPEHLKEARREAQNIKKFASPGEKEREESFIIHSILPSIGSDFFRGQTTTAANYAKTSIVKVVEKVLTPMSPAEEEKAKDPSKIQVEKYEKLSLEERRKALFLKELAECKKSEEDAKREGKGEAVKESAEDPKAEIKEKMKRRRVRRAEDTDEKSIAKRKPSRKLTFKQREDMLNDNGRRKTAARKSTRQAQLKKASVAQRRAFGG